MPASRRAPGLPRPRTGPLPVVYITVPPAATPRMIAVEFARFFGLPAPARANLTDVTNAVCATAARTSVDLVLVDEIHNISLATRAGAEVSDTLKYFAERLPATFVFSGLDVDETGLFTGTRGRQIAGRFTLIPARPFDYGTIELRIRTVHQPLWARWERRLELLMPGTYRRSLFMAAIFPEVAALAAVLAAPPGTDHLLSAVRRALGYAEPPHCHDVSDALSIWAAGRGAGPFLRPASAYSHAGHHDDGTPRITPGRLTAERQTAARFRRDRRAPFIPSPGLPMPYASRLDMTVAARLRAQHVTDPLLT